DRNGLTVVLNTTTGNGLADGAGALAREAAGEGEPSRVVATYEAPATSLGATDDAVCIAGDTP
ncbi:MAG TPA: hypothetical protein VFK02_36830, partial [Kofleriaceae bacterium]|nr:hypothetical protein [Kofleriaceae bacterium]